jgi:hypothetical protein
MSINYLENNYPRWHPAHIQSLVCFSHRNKYEWMFPNFQKEHHRAGALRQTQQHGYIINSRNTLETASQWVG